MGSIIEDLKNAFKRSNNYLNQLIVINLIAWLTYSLIYVLLYLTGSKDIFINYLQYNLEMSSNIEVFITKPWTLFTYFFLHYHAGIRHILFNMLAFYWFGKVVESLVGSSKILGLYFWGGMLGGLFYLIAFNTIPAYANHNGILVGASASVLAVVVGAATLAPNYTFQLFFLGRVKIIYIALAYVVLSILGLTERNAGGEIAHLGGALAGYLFAKQLQNGNDLSKPVLAIIDFFSNLFKTSPKMKVSHKKNVKKNSSKSGGVPQSEIDVILDKISQSGYESLTKEEKNKLFTASQKKD